MRIDLSSGTVAELAASATGSPVAGLVIAPDIFGLRPLFVDLCQRLADEHRVTVCAPEPFPGRDLGDSVEPRFAVMQEMEDACVLGDLALAADATQQAVVHLIGFCMGGMYALKAAGAGRFDRVVSFYGMIRVPKDWEGPLQGQPLDYLARPHVSPTLAVIGEQDGATPPADVAALRAAGVEVVSYPQAGHGFVHDPSRPAHRVEDAADAWRRCFEYLGL